MWQSLQHRYPSNNLDQALVHPNAHTKDDNLILATQKKFVPIIEWLLDEGVEEGGMTKVGIKVHDYDR